MWRALSSFDGFLALGGAQEKTGAYVGFITLLRICGAVVDLCDSINHRNLYSIEYYEQIRRFRQTTIAGLVERPRRREVGS